MKYLIHLTELLLIISYIPILRLFFYGFILRVEYPISMIYLVLVAILISLNLCYILLVLLQKDLFTIKYLTYTSLILTLCCTLNILPIHLGYIYLVQLFISLGITFFHYRGKKLKLNKL